MASFIFFTPRRISSILFKKKYIRAKCQIRDRKKYFFLNLSMNIWQSFSFTRDDNTKVCCCSSCCVQYSLGIIFNRNLRVISLSIILPFTETNYSSTHTDWLFVLYQRNFVDIYHLSIDR